MTYTKLLAPVLAVTALAACGSSSLQLRLEEMEQERQEFLQQNMDLQADVTAYQAKCRSLERAVNAQKSMKREFELPKHLRAKGIRIKRNSMGEAVIDIPSDVFFGSGVTKLSTKGKRTLGSVADLLRSRYPGSSIRIEGHADSDPVRRNRGKFHCNWELSLERAHSVIHFLVDRAGFNPKNLIAAGFGEHKPQDPSNKSRNRRVEIVVMP